MDRFSKEKVVKFYYKRNIIHLNVKELINGLHLIMKIIIKSNEIFEDLRIFMKM